MTKKFRDALRALLVIIPVFFIIGSVLVNCSGSGDDCDGDVTGVANITECENYANDNDCDDFNFENGVCNVVGCDNCEVIVDDLDPVIDDVDDAGF